MAVLFIQKSEREGRERKREKELTSSASNLNVGETHRLGGQRDVVLVEEVAHHQVGHEADPTYRHRVDIVLGLRRDRRIYTVHGVHVLFGLPARWRTARELPPASCELAHAFHRSILVHEVSTKSQPINHGFFMS